jgi:hypothetical protein
MPLDRMFVSVNRDGGVPRAALAARIGIERLTDAQRQALSAKVGVLDALIVYDLSAEPTHLDGLVDLWVETQPGSYSVRNCIVFPPGSERDRSDCRYER